MMRDSQRLGPLGRRLLVAFLLVAALAVALVAAAGLIGSNLGLSTDQTQARRAVAQRVADDTATAYRQADGWRNADLTAARELAAAAGAGLLVLDSGGRTLDSATASHPGMAAGGMGGTGGTGMGPMAGRVSMPVIVDGATVGNVTVGFGTLRRPQGGRWPGRGFLAAAVAALCAAAVAGWAAVRLLTAPLVALTAATRAFAAGDTQARPAVRGIGERGELADAFDEAATAVQRSDQSPQADGRRRRPRTAHPAGRTPGRPGGTP